MALWILVGTASILAPFVAARRAGAKKLDLFPPAELRTAEAVLREIPNATDCRVRISPWLNDGCTPKDADKSVAQKGLFGRTKVTDSCFKKEVVHVSAELSIGTLELSIHRKMRNFHTSRPGAEHNRPLTSTEWSFCEAFQFKITGISTGKNPAELFKILEGHQTDGDDTTFSLQFEDEEPTESRDQIENSAKRCSQLLQTTIRYYQEA